jgi:hypothetical protein
MSLHCDTQRFGAGRKLRGNLLQQLVLFLDKTKAAQHQWLRPIILATQEAEIRRIAVRSQPQQIVS